MRTKVIGRHLSYLVQHITENLSVQTARPLVASIFRNQSLKNSMQIVSIQKIWIRAIFRRHFLRETLK